MNYAKRLVLFPKLSSLAYKRLMWPKNFKDYPNDTPLKHQKVESGKGIIGCEMHEQMGWGADHHVMAKPKKIGFVRRLLYKIFGAPK